jgi:hypothetical protein
MTDWVPIILTAVISGSLGSVITTYGTQTGERRKARAEAREAIRQVQALIYPVPSREQLAAALDNLDTRAMLAGLPEKLTALNRDAQFWQRGIFESVESGDPYIATANDVSFAVHHVAAETTRLLIDATWHPVLGRPRRWWLTRRLSRVMDTPRPGPRPRDKRQWERKAIRKAKKRARHENAPVPQDEGSL